MAALRCGARFAPRYRPGWEGFAGPFSNAIDGLTGWWDAGNLGDILDANGNAIGGWAEPLASLRDKSANGRSLTPFASMTPPSSPVAAPRVNGLLGGAGVVISTSGPIAPILDANTGFQVPTGPSGSASAWTAYLVWSRPNSAAEFG